MRASVTGKPKLRQRSPRTALQWGDTLRELADMHGVGVVAQDEKGNLNTPVRFNREDWTWEGFDGKEWIPTVEGSGTTEIITRIISTVVTGDTISHNATLAKQGGLSPNQYYHLNRAHHDQVGAFLDDAGFPGGVTVGQFSNTGLHIFDTDASHDLIIKAGDGLSADRILTLTTGDAARTITLSGNPTLADWFDQAVKAASGPTFDHLHITNNAAVGTLNVATFGVTVEAASILNQDLTTDASVQFGYVTVNNTGIRILDTDASHALVIMPGSNLTVSRILTLTTGDAARTITLSGSPTLDNWFDQAVKAASSPTFAGVTLGNTGLHILDTNASHDLIIMPGSDLTTDHTLTLKTGDASWSLIFEADATISQDYSTDASPTFAGLTLSGLAAGYLVFTGAGGVLSVDSGVVYNTATDTLTVGNLLSSGAIGSVAIPVPTAYITSLYTNASSVIAGATLGTTTITGSENSAYILSLVDATTGGSYSQGLKVNLRYTAGTSRDIVDFQSGSVSKFKVDGAGTATFAGNIVLGASSDITFSAGDIVTDTTTGTKIGTGTTQKIGFWNATPVVQPAHVADGSGVLSNLVAQFNVLLTRLEGCGILASA